MPELIGPDEVRRVSEAALELSGTDGVDGVEVLFMHEWGGLTRFASSSIHQSTWTEDTALRIRVVKDGRIGVAGTNDLSPEGARAAAQNAREMTDVVAPDPLFPGLAPVDELLDDSRYDATTADTSPERRAEGVAELVGACGDGFVAAGAFETISGEIAV